MAEFDPGADYMQEGYWGNHSPEDNCTYQRLAKPVSSSILGVFKKIWAERQAATQATGAMNDFLRLFGRSLERRLRDGEAFIGESAFTGTIIKFEAECLSLGFRAKTFFDASKPVYHRGSYWGVVAQLDYPNPNQIVVMRISEGFVHPDRGYVESNKFRPDDATLEVGKAVHTRRAENEHWSASEAFHRVLALEIWKSKITEKAAVTKPLRILVTG